MVECLRPRVSAWMSAGMVVVIVTMAETLEGGNEARVLGRVSKYGEDLILKLPNIQIPRYQTISDIAKNIMNPPSALLYTHVV